MNRDQKIIWDALQPLRHTIKGWAFADRRGVEARLAHGEKCLAGLPEHLHVEGERWLAPLRKAIEQYDKP